MKAWSLLFLALLLLTGCAPLTDLLVESGGVLYRESFPDPSTGWPERSTLDGIQGYDRGSYRFLVQTAGRSLIATPGLDLRDARIEVDVAMIGGPEENMMGLVCRYRDERHYYFFVISADGFYAMGKVQGDRLVLIGQEQWQRSVEIQTDVPLNHLRADCVGRQLIFYVNGVAVAAGEDGDYPRGDVGLLAGALARPGVEVYFDNFVVYKP